MTEKKIISVNHCAYGYVYGKCWDGGEGAYPAREYTSTDKAAMLDEIEKDFAAGGLDSGFGFKKLLAAKVVVATTETVTLDGKLYKNKERKEYVFGDDTKLDALDECLEGL